MSPLPRNFLFLVLALFVTSSTVSAQTPPGPPPKPQQRPIPAQPPAVDQEQAITYWTTETGWTSELQLRNNAVAQDLIVTPVLRLADGAETSLTPVTIKPQEVKSIDLGAAISAAAAPQLVGTYGSLALRYRSPSQRSLYAAEMVRETGHPVAFHIDATGPSEKFQAGSREGVWWLPKDTTSDYLILTNQGTNVLPLDLSLYDTSGKENKQRVLLGRYETTRFSVRKLLPAAGLAGSYGGIKVSAAAHAGSLDTLHFLFDETAGFTAILKMFDYDPQTKLQERDYAATGIWTLRAPMLALSTPDPALAFPSGTQLQPRLFIRNTTAKPLDAALRFNWRTASSTGKAPGPQVHLFPYQTRLIDVAALQNGTILPKQANWTSATLTTNALPDEIMAIAASYDQTLQYGAQTPFSDQLTFGWEGGMWEYDPYHNSIITAGNGGTKPTQAAFTIFYNQGTQRYDLEQTLQPDEQMWIDVGKLIREQVPDKNGKPLPSDLTMGSYEFRDLTNKGVGTLFEGKVIYDKTYGHVTYGCAGCCGYTDTVYLFYNPLSLVVGSIAYNYVYAYNTCDSAFEDASDPFYNDWSSGSTSIVTVNAYGAHSGVSAGSTTSQTFGVLNHAGPRSTCPIHEYFPSGGVNVVQAQVTSVDLVNDQVVVNLQGPGTPSGTLLVTWNGPGGNANIANTTEGPGTYTFNPPLANLATGQYTGVTAQWLNASNTYNISFDVLGSYLNTQYNTPAESQCSGSSGTGYVTPGPSACAWNAVNLIQQFITQAWINGSGITNNYGSCQAYLAGCSPPAGGNQNYFRQVSTITPGCSSPNNFLSNTSVAVDVFSTNHPLKCGDQVLIVGLGSGVGTVKTATDSCPACNGAAHIDDYNTSNACSLGTLGNFQTIRINR